MTDTKTIDIYACYLAGSDKPDYIGSHMTKPSGSNDHLKWLYANCKYVGCGIWMDKDGLLHGRLYGKRSAWSDKVLAMTADERMSMRVVVLESVSDVDSVAVCNRLIDEYAPEYNAIGMQTPETRRLKWNAYCRMNSKRYYKNNPEKAEAKRIADMLRSRERRRLLKLAKCGVAC